MKDEIPRIANRTVNAAQLTTATAAVQAQVAQPEAVRKVATAIAEPARWNSKNLVLRFMSDAAAAASAACCVAPIITVIDRSIFENASGRNSLVASVQSSLKEFILRPHSLLFSKPFALICMVYGGTYLTANTLDTVTATVKNKPASHVTAGTTKFFVTSTANTSLGLFKDQIFARLYGPGGPPRPVTLPSFALFALRDGFTIFASFNAPPLLGPVISRQMGEEWNKRVKGQTIAQFVGPAGIQVLSTAPHLLGLDIYNRPGRAITWRDRYEMVKKNWGISTVARICRIVPAFGFGGVVNSKVRRGFMKRLE